MIPEPNLPMDDLAKQRMRLHMKVLGHGSNSQRLKEDKPTYKEKFVAPEVSMISYLMTKVWKKQSNYSTVKHHIVQ